MTIKERHERQRQLQAAADRRAELLANPPDTKMLRGATTALEPRRLLPRGEDAQAGPGGRVVTASAHLASRAVEAAERGDYLMAMTLLKAMDERDPARRIAWQRCRQIIADRFPEDVPS